MQRVGAHADCTSEVLFGLGPHNSCMDAQLAAVPSLSANLYNLAGACCRSAHYIDASPAYEGLRQEYSHKWDHVASDSSSTTDACASRRRAAAITRRRQKRAKREVHSAGSTTGNGVSEAGATCTMAQISGAPASSQPATAQEQPACTNVRRCSELESTRVCSLASAAVQDLSRSEGGPGSPGKTIVSNSGSCGLQTGEVLFDWPTHGYVSICGKRISMEDAMAAVPAFTAYVPKQAGQHGHKSHCREAEVPSTIEPPEALHFFGVYDGHGGPQAATYCAKHLHATLSQELNKSFSDEIQLGGPHNLWAHMERAMRTTFMRVDVDVCRGSYQTQSRPKEESCWQEAWALDSAGTTAIVVVVSKDHIFVGNCGDSRAVLCRDGAAVPLSSDHKPERPDETRRILATGGRIVFSGGYRVMGVLAMSRAIGDRLLKPYIISEPECSHMARTSTDEFIILASDGLWDVISNENACEIVRTYMANRKRSDLAKRTEDGPGVSWMAAALLAKLALFCGSGDNITVLVVDLQPRR